MDEVCKANDHKCDIPSCKFYEVVTRGMSAASYSPKYVLSSFVTTKLHLYQSFPTPGRSGCVLRPAAMFINYVPYEKSHKNVGS
jgi:hypothetical protein